MPRWSTMAFSKEFLKRQAVRRINGFLDEIGGPRAISFLISNNKDLSNYISEDVQLQLKAGAKNVEDIANIFTDDMVLDSLDEKYKKLIYGMPNGKEWAKRQLQTLRPLFFGG